MFMGIILPDYEDEDENEDLSPQVPISLPVEEVNLPQPHTDDAVLGGQKPALVSDAVLGGIEGVKGRLASAVVEQRIAALTEALKYGKAGLDLVIQALNNRSKSVAQSAYFLLRDSSEPIAPQALVVGGTVDSPQLAYLHEPLPVTNKLLAVSGSVAPTEVFRFAAPCANSRCKHFDDNQCHLAKRIVSMLPTVVDVLPACQLRPNCRWWQQEGKSACLRCPQIVTKTYHPSETQRQVSTLTHKN